jgi:hypothetical protein
MLMPSHAYPPVRFLEIAQNDELAALVGATDIAGNAIITHNRCLTFPQYASILASERDRDIPL